MKTSDVITNEIQAKANEMCDKAWSVYRFLSRMPQSLSLFIYKQIIDDALKVASVFPADEAFSQMVHAVCAHFEGECEDITPLYAICGLEDIDIEEYVESREELAETIMAKNAQRIIPDSSMFFLAYPCFKAPDVDWQFVKEVMACMSSKLALLVVDGRIMKSDSTSKMNQFDYLGYLTFFHRWYSKETTADEDTLFYRWYCEGELLDIVLDAVFKSGVTLISRNLWAHICKECEKDPSLSELFNARYSNYRHYNPTVGEYEFLYLGAEGKGEDSFTSSLPRIVRHGEKGFMDNEQMIMLYNRLCSGGFINHESTSFKNFSQVFSGPGHLARRIVWCKSQVQLATFLAECWGHKANKSNAIEAANVFVKPNGDPCEYKTLNQPKFSDPTFYNMFEDIEKLKIN